MTLLEHVNALRRVAMVDPETSSFELALLNLLEDLAAEVERLRGNEPRGLGSV